MNEKSDNVSKIIIWLLVTSLVSIYVTSQYLRTSIGVIAPNIAQDLQLDPRQLAMLSSIFFICFASFQIPLGVLIDKFGPKRAMLGTSVFAVVGTFLFAYAPTYETLLIARAFIGIGCSSFFMVPLIIYGNWFSKDKFSTLTGIQLGFGTGGALLATAPLAYLAAQIGWRETFALTSYVLAAIVVCVILFVKDSPISVAKKETSESMWQMVKSLPSVTKTPSFWTIFWLNACGYSIFATIFTLWGGPFLSEVHGLGLEARGNVLLLMGLGQIMGVFVWGPMDRFFTNYQKPVIIGASSVLIMGLIFAFFVDMPLDMLKIWFFAFGFVCGFTPLIIAHGKSIFDAQNVGRGMTLLNLGNIGGVAVMQTLVGAILKAQIETGSKFIDAFQVGLFTICAIFAVALIIYCVPLVKLHVYNGCHFFWQEWARKNKVHDENLQNAQNSDTLNEPITLVKDEATDEYRAKR